MAVAMILAMPGVADAQFATTWEVIHSSLKPLNLFSVVPPDAAGFVSFVAEEDDGEPTWEDAEWQ